MFLLLSCAEGVVLSTAPLEAGDGDAWTVEDGDCNDADPRVHPEAYEFCDGKDNDCDGAIDEDVLDTFYQDQDGDGFGTSTVTDLACEPEDGWVRARGDCDDLDADIFPGAPDTCDGVDDDCDGLVDEDDVITWYADFDADAYGDAAVTAEACYQPVGFVADGRDCDDTDAAVHPDAPESCDERDEDCDGSVDEGVQSTFYEDRDGDAHGTSASIAACAAPDGYAPLADDCDDADPAAFPGAPETCNGVDDDCDLDTDEYATDAPEWHLDQDADGYGNPFVFVFACDQPAGYVLPADDCDDDDPASHPGAAETCNGIDDDCDGTPDDGC